MLLIAVPEGTWDSGEPFSPWLLHPIPSSPPWLLPAPFLSLAGRAFSFQVPLLPAAYSLSSVLNFTACVSGLLSGHGKLHGSTCVLGFWSTSLFAPVTCANRLGIECFGVHFTLCCTQLGAYPLLHKYSWSLTNKTSNPGEQGQKM